MERLCGNDKTDKNSLFPQVTMNTLNSALFFKHANIIILTVYTVFIVITTYLMDIKEPAT